MPPPSFGTSLPLELLETNSCLHELIIQAQCFTRTIIQREASMIRGAG